jgi:hypothetical protein
MGNGVPSRRYTSQGVKVITYLQLTPTLRVQLKAYMALKAQEGTTTLFYYNRLRACSTHRQNLLSYLATAQLANRVYSMASYSFHNTLAQIIFLNGIAWSSSGEYSRPLERKKVTFVYSPNADEF